MTARKRRGRPRKPENRTGDELRAWVDADPLAALTTAQHVALEGLPAVKHETIMADVSHSERTRLRAEVQIDLPELPESQRDALTEGLVALVGYQRVMAKGQRRWPRVGRGNKPRIDLAAAVRDCGTLWTRVTGHDWRHRAGWTGADGATSDEILGQQPAVILARELLRLATGRAHPGSLDRAFRRALKLDRQAPSMKSALRRVFGLDTA